MNKLERIAKKKVKQAEAGPHKKKTIKIRIDNMPKDSTIKVTV